MVTETAVAAGAETTANPNGRRVARVGLPRRIVSRRDLAEAVGIILDEWFPQTLPTQALTSAFSMRLAHDLARIVSKRECFILGSPHSNETREFLKGKKFGYLGGEFQGVFSVVTADGDRIRTLVACESEGHAPHATQYCPGIEVLRERRAQEYVWGFSKLIHTRSPVLVYVTRMAARRAVDLQDSLTTCAARYSALWENATLLVVQLPTAARDRDATRLGYGVGGGHLYFASLADSRQPWITGEEYRTEASRLWSGGNRSVSPELDRLRHRLLERDDYIWARFAVPLLERHSRQWCAITIDGDYLLGNSRAEVTEAARHVLGKASALVARLDRSRGIPRLGPRADA